MIKIDYVKNLHPIFTKPKRFKLIVGGRGSTKSTGVAKIIAAKMSKGELWCCARENQNSIEESVHRTILDEISRLGMEGFTDTKTSIVHEETGGRCFYRGLARNITSLKSTLFGVDGLWIEEGEDISANTLRVLTASVRLNAKDTEKLLNGKKLDSQRINKLLENSDIKMPEVIITMNRGARAGAVARKWLERAEDSLSRCGYYEDDTVMVVQMNYTDMPKSWFIASGLEQERLDDKEQLSQASYDHKWHGDYMDEVENSIIKPEWFDAAIDAHKLPHLEKAFEPHGMVIAAHDPFDDGNDAAGFAVRHGSIIKTVQCKDKGEIDVCCDWATDLAKKYNADWFVWDGDGMGTGLKRQVSDNLKGSKMSYHMFKGSLSGSGQDNAEEVYQDVNDKKDEKPKTYAETFRNNRAQYYIELARLFYNTYRCVTRGEYVDPDEMISLDSEGIKDMLALRSQVRIPRKVRNTSGLQQIMSKAEMKTNDIESPNEADSVMMCLYMPEVKESWADTSNYEPVGIV